MPISKQSFYLLHPTTIALYDPQNQLVSDVTQLLLVLLSELQSLLHVSAKSNCVSALTLLIEFVAFSTDFLIDVQHFKGLVWRKAGKFACCVLGQGT